MPETPRSTGICKHPLAQAFLGTVLTLGASSGAPAEKPRQVLNTVREKVIKLVAVGQGDTNNCGPCSLRVVSSLMGKPVTVPEVRKQVPVTPARGTSPEDMLKVLHSLKGVRAKISSNTTLADIRGLIDANVAPIAVVDPNSDGSDFSTHYLVISGYREKMGAITQLQITDSIDEGSQTWESTDDFFKKWSDIHVHDAPTGINRMIIAGTDQVDVTLPGDNQWGSPEFRVYYNTLDNPESVAWSYPIFYWTSKKSELEGELRLRTSNAKR